MIRKVSKGISMVLIFALAFGTVAPKTAVAASPQNQGQASNVEEPTPHRVKSQTRILELEDQRDQHTKYYLNSDGSTTAETTVNSRHYQDTSGKWQDISNKLVPSDEAGFALRNDANSYKTHFANNSLAGSLVKVKLDQNLQFAWSLDDANHVMAVNDDYSVTYPDILPSVDLQYVSYSDGLKENIILKDNGAQNSFQFQLKTTGLNPIPQSDGSIALQEPSSGETKFVLQAPYMFDNNQQMSQDVSMTLEATSNPNVYNLIITANSDWLNDPARTFPVTIDPTVNTEYANVVVGDAGSDTYIASNSSYQYYNSSYMTTGKDASLGQTRSLVKFVLPTIPSGAIVTDSVLSLYKYTTTSYTEELNAYRITEPWSSLTVNWANQPAIDDTFVKTEKSYTTVAGSYLGYVDFNVWSIVKGWIHDSANIPNNGFMIQHEAENNPLFFYYTSNNGVNQPKLSITYVTDQIGLNPYWSYANTSTGSVNTFNGNYLTSVQDYSLPGRGNPINVTRTYNSRFRTDLTGLFGKKWFSNLDMQLKFPVAPETNWGIVLIDSAGTERPFMAKSDGSGYIAPDNYPLQLYKTTESGLTVYKLQEAYQDPNTGQTVYAYATNLPTAVFNSTGQLIRLEDGKGNNTTITYNGTTSITVTDASGRKIRLDRVNNKITHLYELDQSGNPVALKATYQYEGDYLTKVTYVPGTADEASLNYNWNSANLLDYITDKNGKPTYLGYNSSSQLISTGLVNSVGNPNFEATTSSASTDPYSWTKTIISDAGTINQSSAQKKYSKNSLQIKSVDNGATSGTSYLYVTQKIPIKPGQAYTLSAWQKTEELAGKAFLNTRQLDANGVVISGTWIDTRGSSKSGTVDWAQTVLTLDSSQINSNARYLEVYLEVEHDATQFGGEAYFDGVQLEMGSTVTSFQGHSDFRYFNDGGFPAAWITSPEGNEIEYKNNNYGNPTYIIENPKGTQAKTTLTWDAADRLRSLTTPEQQGTGKNYIWSYDPVGNLIQSTDALGRTTEYEYYYNRIKTLTQPDSGQVINSWDPVTLNGESSENQLLNSQAMTYNSYGNPTTETNIIGVADNRIINNGFEAQPALTQPVFSRSTAAYKTDGTRVNANVARYEPGKFGNAVLIEEGTTNLLNSQGGGASTDWTKWSHWGNRSYWSSEVQTNDPVYGNVYTGTNANAAATYLFDYFPYTVTAGTSYTISVMLKASQNWTGSTTAYINKSDYTTLGSSTKNISLTTSWQRYSWTVTADQSATSSVGQGIKFLGLPSGVQLSAAEPQFEQLPYATTYIDTARSGDLLTIPTSAFSASQGTIEAWVKPLRTPGTSVQMITDVAETGLTGLILAIGTDGKFYIQSGTGSQIITAKSQVVAEKDSWYYVAGTWNSTGISIYVNGQKVDTAGVPAINLAYTPTIGRESSVDRRWFDGLIDDIRISNRAKTVAELDNAYGSGKALTMDASTTYKMELDSGLTADSGYYQPLNWAVSSPAGTVNRAEYDPGAPNGGSNVLHINPGANPSAYQITSDYIALTGVNDFIISGDIKSTASTTGGASLNVLWYDVNHAPIGSEVVNFNVQNNTWQHYSKQVTPPDGSVYAKIKAVTNSPNVDGYFDNIQFEKSTTARGYNGLDNSSFERQSAGWTPSDAGVTVVNDSDAFSGLYETKINRTTIGTSYMESGAVLPIKQGEYYTIAGFSKTDALIKGTNGGARIHTYIYNSSGAYVNDFITKLVTEPTDWTKYAYSFQAPVDGIIKIRLELYNAQGIAKFDNIRFSQGRLTTSYGYDANNNYVTSIKDQMNNATTIEVDNYGNPLIVTAPSGEQITYGYDGLERLKTVTDDADSVTTYGLDQNGNVKTIALKDTANKTYNATSFEYDDMNNLIKETDALNNYATFTYDLDGRLTGRTNYNSSGVKQGSLSTTYDIYSNIDILSLFDAAGTVTDSYDFQHDLDGRRVKETVTKSGTPVKEFNYGYDAVGNLTSYSETDADDNPITTVGTATTPNTYSSLNQLLSFNLQYKTNPAIPFSFSYSKGGLVTQASGDGKTVYFDYDDGNNLIGRTIPNGSRDSYIYNEANKIVGSQSAVTGNNHKWLSNYEYNQDGRLTKITNGAGSTTAEYFYNNGTEKLNRLTQASITAAGSTYTFDYQYDAAGNMLSMEIPNGSGTQTLGFTYDADNRITNSGFAYDANGNLTQATLNGKMYNYAYDAANRLIQVTDTSTNPDKVINYSYDADGLRLSKTVNDGVTIVTTNYHYFQGQLMYETVGDAITALYLRSATGTLQAVKWNGSYYYYHYNAHGDVTGVTNSTGSVYRQYFYDPYGNLIKVQDGSGDPINIDTDSFNHAYTYAGYRYDKETGLYFLNARYYAPEIGRFLTKDIWQGSKTNPKSLNSYAYCEGDPVNLVDHGGDRPDVTGGPEGPDVANNTGQVNPNAPPTPKSGYQAPKTKGNLKPVKAPNGQYGWPDKWGNVWMPVPEGHPNAHGGEHWDVQYPSGGYDNVYPDGFVRKGNGARGRFSPAGARFVSNSLNEQQSSLNQYGVQLTGGALAIYLIVSEGSRLFLPRNLIPVP